MKMRISLIAAFLLVAQASLPVVAQAATITVSNTGDSGAGSLRAALASAADGDTIDATGVSGTIFLTSGELLVTNSLTILGPGPATLAVNGNFPNTTNRVFHIINSVTASISSLTITKGRTPSFGSGGGIFNAGATLTVSNCTVTGNSAFNGGGGIFSSGGATATLTIVDSIISSNSNGNGNGGGGIDNAGAMLTVSNSTVIGNSSPLGGGIFNSGVATLTIAYSAISSNSSDIGGGIYNDGCCNGAASLIIVNSTLSGNRATVINGDGGGIYNIGVFSGSATVTISNSTLSGNFAVEFGGGIYNDGQSSAPRR